VGEATVVPSTRNVTVPDEVPIEGAGETVAKRITGEPSTVGFDVAVSVDVVVRGLTVSEQEAVLPV
jgi:hypothetical protein